MKDIHGAVHEAFKGQEFTLPFETFDKKTTRKMNIEYVETSETISKNEKPIQQELI